MSFNFLNSLKERSAGAYQCFKEGINKAQSFWIPADHHEDYTVPLSQLQFENEQPADSKVKYSENRSIATRTDDDYCCAFVNLRNTLTSNEFILIQILEVDQRHVGGLKLYRQPLGSNGKLELLFADSRCKPYDRVIVWMNTEDELYCEKDGEIHLICEISEEAEDHKLVCEMYGPVQQIRAFVGYLSTDEENGSNLRHNSPENSYLSIRIRGRCVVEKLTVANLPTTSHSASNTSAICSGTNGTGNSPVETCKICMDVDADTVIIPCGHLVSCYECASRCTLRCGSVCPICRTEIKTYHKIYSRTVNCQKCGMGPANVILLPCGDTCLCDPCSINAKNCPVCRMFVDGRQKIV